VRLLLGLVYSVAIPLGEAPDEADHLAYAAYIANEHRLPEGTWMTQAKHPPLYHALAALTAGWAGMDTGFLRANPDVGFTPDASPNFFIHTMVESWPWRDGPLAMHLARLISVLAGVGLVSATYVLGRAIWPGRPAVALAAAAFVAFLPESLFIGGAVSNDMLAAFLATMALWAGLRSRTYGQAILTGILMGLGLWAKVSVAALWPVVCFAMVAKGWDDGRPTTDEKRETRNEKRSASSWWRPWALAIVAGSVALLVTAPWFLRNRQLYGDWMGWPLVLATIDRRTGPFGLVELAWLMRGLFLGFWGKFGGAGHISLPWPFYALWAALVSASALGWLRRAWEWAKGGKGERANRQSAIRNPQSAIVLLGAPLMTIAWLLTYSRVALGTDQGRLLFPAIAPLALLLVGGLAQWLPRTWREHESRWLAGWTGFMGAIAVLALVTGLVLPFVPPAELSAVVVAGASPVGRTFGGGLELVGYRWEPALADIAPDRALTLYWRVDRPIDADLRTSLRLTDAGSAVLWEWKRSPGAGRFSTDRWPLGRVVADTYRVPSHLLGRAAQVEIGVRPFPEGPWLRQISGASSLGLSKPGQQ